MKVRIFGCRKFQVLSHVQTDRELTARESSFMKRHRTVCRGCREMEFSAALALNMLRASALEPEIPASFEERVLRKLKIQTVRNSLGYWSPAFVGAAIACLALFAALQMISNPSQAQPFTLPDGTARSDVSTTFPDLELRNVPRIQ